MANNGVFRQQHGNGHNHKNKIRGNDLSCFSLDIFYLITDY